MVPRGVPSRTIRVTSDVSLDLELDVDDRLARTPPHDLIRGMFLTRHVRALGARFEEVRSSLSVPPPYQPFGEYPQRDHARLAVAVARLQFPAVPVAEGLRRVERHAAEVFVASSIGRALTTLASNPLAALRLFPTAWRHMQTGGELVTRELPHSHGIRLEVRDLAPWLDCSMIGSLEGGVVLFGRRPMIEVELLSDHDANYLVTWT